MRGRACCTGTPMTRAAAWTELPELVTANQGEEGIAELCDVLLERGYRARCSSKSLRKADDGRRQP